MRRGRNDLKLPMIPDHRPQLVSSNAWAPHSPPRKKSKPFHMTPLKNQKQDNQPRENNARSVLPRTEHTPRQKLLKQRPQEPKSVDDMDDCSRPLTAIEEEHICLQQARTSHGNLTVTQDPKVIGRRRSVSMGQGAWAALRDSKGNLNMFVDGKDGRRTSMISVVGLAMFRKLYAAEMARYRKRQQEKEEEMEEEEEEVKYKPRRRTSIISTMSVEAQKAMQGLSDDDMD